MIFVESECESGKEVGISAAFPELVTVKDFMTGRP